MIADDHPLTREGLSLAARAAVPGAVPHGVGSIAEARSVLERWPSCRMILLDFMLPDAHGFAGFLALQTMMPATPIVVISAREEMPLVEAAKALGAVAFLFKSRPLDEIAAQLRQVADGLAVFPHGIAESRGVAAARERIDNLSPAQRTVLLALADGRSNKQIAYDLSVTEATVKAHLTAIFRKLGVTNRAQALLAVQALLSVDAGRG